MDSSPSKLVQQLPSETTPKSLSTHSQKPSLLPAFGEDNFSSSPFPRPGSSKRKFEEDSPSFARQQLKYYPTPVPTSSTGILNFSSPRHVRPALQRAVSALSERTLSERCLLSTSPRMENYSVWEGHLTLQTTSCRPIASSHAFTYKLPITRPPRPTPAVTLMSSVWDGTGQRSTAVAVSSSWQRETRTCQRTQKLRSCWMFRTPVS